MITPVMTPLLTSADQTTVPKRSSAVDSAAIVPTGGPAPSGQGLAHSIMADGGLGFLQARMQEKMEGLFGTSETPTDLGFDSSLDVSPEATADRIVGFALSLRSVYERQNEGLSQDDLRAGFEQAIRRGISEGFGHAQGVLSGLDFLEGEVQDNVDLTWELVQQRLEEIFNPQTATPE